MSHNISEKKIEYSVELIKKILPINPNKTLIWDMKIPYDRNGKQNQYGKSHTIDYEKHIQGELNQGGNLCYEDENGNKVAKASVCDVDTPIEANEFCKKLFSVDSTAIPIRSPSGKNWHVYKFHTKPIPVKEAHQWARDICFKLADLGYKIDFGKCNPSSSGSDVGINLPFNSFNNMVL